MVVKPEKLTSRAVTAILFAGVLILAVLIHPVTLLFLLAFIVSQTSREYAKILDRLSTEGWSSSRKRIVSGITLLVFAALLYGELLMGEYGWYWRSGVAALGAFYFIILTIDLFRGELKAANYVPGSWAPSLYIALPLACAWFIGYSEGHFYGVTLLQIFILTWLQDSGAYIFGSMFGKKALFPAISPNKTWEGFLGGAFLNLLGAVLCYFIFHTFYFGELIVISLVIAVGSTIGDLLESKIKRKVNLKDSGSLLPGHGGLMDRFDGFIYILPFITLYLLLVKKMV